MKIENMNQIAKCFRCCKKRMGVHFDCEPYRMFFRDEEIELGETCPRYLAFERDMRKHVLGYDDFEYPEMARVLMSNAPKEPAKEELK